MAGAINLNGPTGNTGDARMNGLSLAFMRIIDQIDKTTAAPVTGLTLKFTEQITIADEDNTDVETLRRLRDNVGYPWGVNQTSALVVSLRALGHFGLIDKQLADSFHVAVKDLESRVDRHNCSPIVAYFDNNLTRVSIFVDLRPRRRFEPN